MIDALWLAICGCVVCHAPFVRMSSTSLGFRKTAR
jgi:hypothetical protein